MNLDNNERSCFCFFASWSGGKDSCLALYRALRAGNTCVSLFTMVDETGEHSRSHGLYPDVLRAQAAAMGLPIVLIPASWDDYEQQFKKNAGDFRTRGILHGVFGDIDLEPHRQWVERVCSESGLTAHEPLWQGERRELVHEFICAGFKAIIVVVDTNRMPAEFLGREIDEALVSELEAVGVDACGENGEFHTFVYDGPLFRRGVEFNRGEVFCVGHHRVMPVITDSNPPRIS